MPLDKLTQPDVVLVPTASAGLLGPSYIAAVKAHNAAREAETRNVLARMEARRPGVTRRMRDYLRLVKLLPLRRRNARQRVFVDERPRRQAGRPRRHGRQLRTRCRARAPTRPRPAGEDEIDQSEAAA